MAQIGTVRLETQNSGVVDVPVFEPGDSASGIYEFVRVETASGPGFIPVTDPVDATYPYLRVQSQNNGIVAVTDTPGSDIPDSAVLYWPMGAGSGTTVADDIGSNDGTFNGGPTWTNDSNFIDGYKVTLDGDGDYIQADNNTAVIGPDMDFSVGVTLDTDSSINDIDQVWEWGNGSEHFSVSFRDGDITGGYFDGSSNIGTAAHPEPSAPYTIRLLFTWDGSANNGELYLNTDSSTTSALTRGSQNQGLTLGAQTSGIGELTGSVDAFVVYDKILSTSEIDDDYQNQPWT